MAVRKHSDGKWMFDVYYINNGKRKRKRKYGYFTKKEAKEAEVYFINNKEDVDTQKLDCTVADGFKNMINYQVSRFDEKTINSKTSYYNSNIKPYIANVYIGALTFVDIINFQNILHDNGKSNKMINTATNLLSQIYNFNKKIYKYNNDPFDGIEKLHTVKNEKKVYSENQFHYFEENIYRFIDYCFYNIAFYTGGRVGEILALTWKDIDFSNQLIVINKSVSFNKNKGAANFVIGPTKTRKTRKVKIPSFLITLLKSLKDYNKKHKKEFNNSWYILKDIEPHHYETVRYRHSVYSKRANNDGLYNIGIHDLRHSHASLLISRRNDIVSVSKRLGHSNVRMTLETYTHLLEHSEDELISSLEA